MKLIPTLVLTVSVLALSSSAFASSVVDRSEAPPRASVRPEVGLRTGWAMPFGEFETDAKLSQLFAGQAPLWVDAGVRLNRHLFVGGYFQYGIARPSDDCAENCSGSVIRFGIDAQVHLRPDTTIDPWLGLGSGYEISHLRYDARMPSGAALPTYFRLSGFEIANLQAGVDLRVVDALTVGPFVSWSLGRYQSEKFLWTDGDSGNMLAGADQRFHQWLLVGVRGNVRL